jgi:hypothetical protein
MTTEYQTGPVPLYLIAQALSTEIRKNGDILAEVHIRRTSGHNYLITICCEPEEGVQDE